MIGSSDSMIEKEKKKKCYLRQRRAGLTSFPLSHATKLHLEKWVMIPGLQLCIYLIHSSAPLTLHLQGFLLPPLQNVLSVSNFQMRKLEVSHSDDTGTSL